MSHMAKKKLDVTLIILLTVAGFVSLYQIAFDLWMTAYPYANGEIWKQRLWERLATAALIGALWIFVATRLIGASRRRH
jgi:hypothetical protein